jgi:SanA protein
MKFLLPSISNLSSPTMASRGSSRRRIIRWSIAAVLGVLLLVILVDTWVEAKTDGLTYNDSSEIPYRKVGLLLGTAKYSTDGQNKFYLGRIQAAVKLFDAGKVDHILISGDNGSRYYNEPKQFREDLIRLGIPSEAITLDYAGFRTLDSVIRAKEVFGQDSITVISQEFQNERAIFIADAKGLDAIGFNAVDVSGSYGLKTKVRERFARVKMVWDLLIGQGPRYLGEPVLIP